MTGPPKRARSVLAAIAALLVAASCGKVGTPQPPFIRIPEAVRDFTASQNGYNVILSWTNPAHYVDASNASDLATAHIVFNGNAIAVLPATGAGKPQSYSIPARDWIGTERTYGLFVMTSRGKTSPVATISAVPVDVPGPVAGLNAAMDQYSLNVEWQPPLNNPQLVDGYFVHRADVQEPPVLVHETTFKDPSFEAGKDYTFQVSAARQVDGRWILGESTQSVDVPAVDKIPPKTPAGLQIAPSDTGAFITWTPNQELDLAGYRVFRDGKAIGPGDLKTSNSYFDSEYHPGAEYTVSAVDQAGNESRPSEPVKGVLKSGLAAFCPKRAPAWGLSAARRSFGPASRIDFW